MARVRTALSAGIVLGWLPVAAFLVGPQFYTLFSEVLPAAIYANPGGFMDVLVATVVEGAYILGVPLLAWWLYPNGGRRRRPASTPPMR